MISRDRIRRLIEAGAWGRLVEQVLGNGRCRSSAVAATLSGRLACDREAAAIALALLRVTELTYGADPLLPELATRLLRLQDADGTFGNSPRPLAATALALRALDALVRDGRFVDRTGRPDADRPADPRDAPEAGLLPHLLHAARDRALDAVERLLSDTGAPKAADREADVERAVALQQLAALPVAIDRHAVAA